MEGKTFLVIKAELSSIEGIRGLLVELEALEQKYQLHVEINFNPLVSCFQVDFE